MSRCRHAHRRLIPFNVLIGLDRARVMLLSLKPKRIFECSRIPVQVGA